jgi:hypothetical protein
MVRAALHKSEDRGDEKRDQWQCPAGKAQMKTLTEHGIQSSDLWSAIRDLGMLSMSYHELLSLRAEHESNSLFTGQVIAEAARQCASLKALR